MNYTLKQLQDKVSRMIEEQGEDAECGAWIYTKNDCHLKDEDGNTDYDNNVEDPALIARIFDDVGNVDYIYTVIQEAVDEAVEEQLVQYQQELVEVQWEVRNTYWVESLLLLVSLVTCYSLQNVILRWWITTIQLFKGHNKLTLKLLTSKLSL